MGHIDRELRRQRTKFDELEAQSAAHGDKNDCTVKALAVLGEIPYATARGMMAELGRKKGKGASTYNVLRALGALGKKSKKVPAEHFIGRYPTAHRILKHVTSHHMDRFADVWQDGQSYLCATNTHVFAVEDGVNHDWTRGRAFRVVDIYRVG
jgi:hypothetical protein